MTLSPGVVHPGWLELPNFYSALRLDPASPDRAWWTAAPAARLREAARRQHAGIALLNDVEAVRRLLERSFAVLGADVPEVAEWRITPRWQGYV